MTYWLYLYFQQVHVTVLVTWLAVVAAAAGSGRVLSLIRKELMVDERVSAM